MMLVLLQRREMHYAATEKMSACVCACVTESLSKSLSVTLPRHKKLDSHVSKQSLYARYGINSAARHTGGCEGTGKVSSSRVRCTDTHKFQQAQA